MIAGAAEVDISRGSLILFACSHIWLFVIGAIVVSPSFA